MRGIIKNGTVSVKKRCPKEAPPPQEIVRVDKTHSVDRKIEEMSMNSNL